MAVELQVTTTTASVVGTLFGESAGHYPDRPALAHGQLDRLPSFFTEGPLSSLDALVEVYRGPVKIAGGKGQAFDQVQIDVVPERIADLHKMGLTLFFADVAHVTAEAAAWLATFAGDLGMPRGTGRMGLFASRGGGGLPCHYDPNEAFILQLHGRKQVRIAPGSAPHPYRSGLSVTENPHLDHFVTYPGGVPTAPPPNGKIVELAPGSALFLPRGYWHETLAEEESFSCSVVFECPNAIDLLLPVLALKLMSDPAWRRPFYRAWGDASAREHAEAELAELLRDLPSRLKDLSPKALIGFVEPRDDKIAALDATTKLQRNPSTRVHVAPENDGHATVEVSTHADRLQAEPDLTEALVPIARRLLDQRGVFRLRDIPSEGDPDAAVALAKGLANLRVFDPIPL